MLTRVPAPRPFHPPHPPRPGAATTIAVWVHTSLLAFTFPPPSAAPRRWRGDGGQATTEYALVLLAAALVGLLVIGWATAGGGAAKVGHLFDRVIDSVIDKV